MALDTRGSILFDFHRLWGEANAPFGPGHCYALNVADDRNVWVYYWSEFSLVRLENRRVRWRWDTIPVKFSGAVAVAVGDRPQDTWLLMAIEPRFSRLYRLSLGQLCAEELVAADAEWRVISYRRAFGRGNRLYLVHDEGISVFQVQPLE